MGLCFPCPQYPTVCMMTMMMIIIIITIIVNWRTTQHDEIVTQIVMVLLENYVEPV